MEYMAPPVSTRPRTRAMISDTYVDTLAALAKMKMSRRARRAAEAEAYAAYDLAWMTAPGSTLY